MGNQRIIFSNSYSPRTGHNFASEIVKVFSGHEVLKHNKSETRLSNVLDEYYKIRSTIFHDTDSLFLDDLILKNIRTEIISKSDRNWIMIKNTSFKGVNYLPRLFPNDIHILILRNPEDVYTSYFKGLRKNKKGFKEKVKGFLMLFGIYQYYFIKKVSKKVINDIPDFSKYEVFKYEDLFLKKKDSLLRLKQIFNCSKSVSDIQEEIDNINVINTSFYKEINASSIWDEHKKTKKYNPINRKSKNLLIRIAITYGSRKLKNKLTYN